MDCAEQIVGVRGDVRSDIFAIGVMLYELTTGELPFGAPTTEGGMRQRMWMAPTPPRALRADVPDWLQESSCAAWSQPPPSAMPAPPSWPLTWSTQSKCPSHAAACACTAYLCWASYAAGSAAAGMEYQPSPLPVQQITEVPILMVAVPHKDVSDATLYSLRQAVARSLSTRPGARLAAHRDRDLALGQQQHRQQP